MSNEPINLSQSSFFVFSSEVQQALHDHAPITALETAVVTHGLPFPHNLSLGLDLEAQIRSLGVVPATIGLLDGKVHIGLTADELHRLATEPARKISRRDYGAVLASRQNGGTTVAGTLIAARSVGIQVFATGGIGGVHRDSHFDISADLPELSRSPLVVVCAGAKAILDLPATMEYLETMGVPVIGYQTDEFPAFYSSHSGLGVDYRADSPEEIAQIAVTQWALGIESAVLVVNPPPPEAALPKEIIENAVQQALEEARQQNISGARMTPFLLTRVSQMTHGDSLQANLSLLQNNAQLAARIAACISKTA